METSFPKRLTKQIRDFILIHWVYDNIYKNEKLQLISLSVEKEKLQNFVSLFLNRSEPEIVEVLTLLEHEGDNNLLLKKLDLILQKTGEVTD